MWAGLVNWQTLLYGAGGNLAMVLGILKCQHVEDLNLGNHTFSLP